MNFFKNWLDYLTVLSLIVMVIGVFLQVLFRFVLKISAPWTEELVIFSLVFSVFLGATNAVKNKAHYTVELIDSILPISFIKYVKAFANLLVLVFLCFFVYYSWQYANSSMTQITPALKIPKGYIYMIAPISGIVMMYYIIISFFTKKRRGEK